MDTLAFLLDGHRWAAPPADLITPGFLWAPAILTPICCSIVTRNRRHVSYAVGLAAIPAALVFGRMFFRTLQYDLRYVPNQQIMIALFVALLPGAATGVVYLLRCVWPNQSGVRATASDLSKPGLGAASILEETTNSVRYQRGDDDQNEGAAGAKMLLIGLTAVTWLLIFFAFTIAAASAFVGKSATRGAMDSAAVFWCVAGAFFLSLTTSMAWLFAVRRGDVSCGPARRRVFADRPVDGGERNGRLLRLRQCSCRHSRRFVRRRNQVPQRPTSRSLKRRCHSRAVRGARRSSEFRYEMTNSPSGAAHAREMTRVGTIRHPSSPPNEQTRFVI